MDPWDPADWSRISPILDAALDAPPGRREAVIAAACEGDEGLRDAVRRLAGLTEPAGEAGPADGAPVDRDPDPLGRPAAEFAAELLSTASLPSAPDLLSTPPTPSATGRAAGSEAVEGEEAGHAARTGGSVPGAPEQRVVGGYRLLGLLGRGGMGEVYRALHPTLQREVALKVLPARLTRSPDARRRLIEEARAASTLDHPAIQTVYDAGETDGGGVYVAFALYEGPTLRERLAAEGPLDVAGTVRIGMGIARGLEAAHRHGIVHRDVKPSNVIVLADDRVKILDFGVATKIEARETGGATGDRARPGATYGTLAYMSPEQVRGEAVDARADVWALGVVLYEMVAGARPFRGETDRRLIRAIQFEEPPAPEGAGSPALAAIIDRCLAKHPGDRFGDMGALAAALEAVVLGPSAADGARGSGAGRVGLGPFRRPALAAAAAFALVAAAVLYATTPWRTDAGPADAASVVPAASSMTILPFTAISDDTALARLGRHLAVTLSTNVNGMGAIHTTEGLSVLSAMAGAAGGSDAADAPEASDGPQASEPSDASSASADGRVLARRFGSTSYVRGTLLEAGGGSVRVDGAVHDTRTAKEIGRFAVTGPGGDIASLTDSLTLALVRVVWRAGGVPSPSLAALTTPSVPALRAYLDGELLLAAGDFVRAVAAFDSAFQTDSAFWFALYRSIYPRTYEGAPRLGEELAQKLFENRAALPESDRLLLESLRLPTTNARIAALRDIVRRFPSHLPGWWSYANGLVHSGPYAGVPIAETRRALERTLELDPMYFPAWDHLLWVSVIQRDRERAAEALGWLEGAGRRGNRRVREELGPTYRALVAGLDGPLDDEALQRRVDAILTYRGPLAPFFAVDLLMHGDPVSQSMVNAEVLRRGAPPGMEQMHRIGAAAALAARGDWTGAVETASFADPTRFGSPFYAYELAVVGAWLGELAPEDAARERPTPERLATEADPQVGAQLAWLDGVLAFARADGGARPAAEPELHAALLDSARARVRAANAPFSPDLARSLEAFGLALAGDSAGAGRLLAGLEQEAVDAFSRRGAAHPWLAGVNRLAAARWLAVGGDTLQALVLLGWEETVLPESSGGLWPAGIALSPHASLLRARLHAARGDSQAAAFHYATVLHRYDRAAGAAGAERVREARAFLEKSSPRLPT